MSKPMSEKTPHELACEFQFKQHEKELFELKERAEKRTGALFKKGEALASQITTIQATLKERERAGGSAKDTAVKVGCAIFAAFISVVVGGLINKMNTLEQTDAINKTAFIEWVAHHEKVIENRDTVQCKDLQAVQLSLNASDHLPKVIIVECGKGAG